MIPRLAWVFASSLILVACSSDTSTGGGGGGSSGGGSGSSSSSGGASSGSGGGSGSTSSSGGGSGGSTSSSGGGSGSGSGGSSGGSGSGSGSSSGGGSGSGSGGSSSGCMTPSDCPGEACCATIPITGGSVPNCTTGTLTAVCKAKSACPTQLAGFSCSGTEQVQICSAPSDCTNAGSGNTLCCTFTNDAGSLSFCANGIIGGVGGGKCM